MNSINKFLLLIFIFSCFSFNNNNKINDSRQKQEELSNEKQKPLIALCQLWGFLKYHHPSVAEGNYDWDKELISKISEIQKSKDELSWKKILNNWIDNLPQVPLNESKSIPDRKTTLEPNYGELFNPDYFLVETIEKIDYILKNAIINESHYIHVDQQNGLMTIKNEPDYKEILIPDLSYRLLALFKHWNLVNYFFPYREKCGQDWNAVLVEMLPEFIHAENFDDYLLTCLKLHTKIDDSHGFYNSRSTEYYMYQGMYQAPIDVSFIKNELVVIGIMGNDGVVEKAVDIGDIITAIDGEPVKDRVKRMLAYTPASNHAVKLRNILNYILRQNNKTIELTLLKNDNCRTVKINCYSPGRLAIPDHFAPIQNMDGYQILDNNIGYVLPSSCKEKDREKGIVKVLNNTKGVIIDFRCYPDDYFSLSFREHLPFKFTKFSTCSYANVSFPGYFFVSNPENFPNRKVNPNAYTNPIVVLVNEFTQSSAEDNVLVLQSAENTKVIGSKTAGANGKVTHFNLPCGIVTSMTGLGVYYPDGSDLQQTGVKINEYIEPSIEGIKEGRDELLERAIEIIEEYNKNRTHNTQ